ncbi:hypothetical protein [Spirilliplanes yamanashiensis]|uniref:HTH cro/C1-type domain-containing protein n=1 Tax=Spirilliplanes yamanashiensis TaxID=42233 RepID=A0A8J3YET6_9ACTN|nr:hypothetical protein [Spirilliplanes yamanashiensis]MDP9818475.1 hypothetical protein [Spirilliplanes yamanashiensis]GIJ06400.1 hypothetical protein Sya03_57520 [Spirilliplanes yamanashiensis]
MTDRAEATPVRASDLVATQIRQIRGHRGLTVRALAARCAELGGAHLTANVLTNIEVRGRGVSVDELLVLALALDVAPVHLLIPPIGHGADLAVTDQVAADPLAAAAWIRGEAPLPPANAAAYLAYAVERAEPTGRAQPQAAEALKARAAGLAAQYEAEAQQFLGKVRQQVTDLVTYLEESVGSGVPTDDLLQVLETVRHRVQPPAAVVEASVRP